MIWTECTISDFSQSVWGKLRPVIRPTLEPGTLRIQKVIYHWILYCSVRILLHYWKRSFRVRETLARDNNKRNAKKRYTGCETTRTGYSAGRCRLTAPHGDASGHVLSTRGNLVTNFSCEDLTSAFSGCEGLWKHITSFINISLFIYIEIIHFPAGYIIPFRKNDISMFYLNK